MEGEGEGGEGEGRGGAAVGARALSTHLGWTVGVVYGCSEVVRIVVVINILPRSLPRPPQTTPTNATHSPIAQAISCPARTATADRLAFFFDNQFHSGNAKSATSRGNMEFGMVRKRGDKKVRETHHITYPSYTPFNTPLLVGTIFAPMYIRYTCIYNHLYTPYHTPLTHL